jgi:hypothetical protein
MEIQHLKKEEKVFGPISPEKFEELWIHVFDRFDIVRAEIYNFMMDANLTPYETKLIMLKAYCQFAAVASTTGDGKVTRSRWSDLVTEAV